MRTLTLTLLPLLAAPAVMAQQFTLNESGYYNCEGVDVMAFNDFYPEGHQGGISILMNGHRIATNGDIRLEPTPGQWQPVPKQLSRSTVGNSIITHLCYPDSSRHMTGFNPMIYPDLQLRYSVSIEPAADGSMTMTVNLEQPVPAEYVGKVGFNLEFFPGELFGRPWLMDQQSGIFPQQPNSPTVHAASNTAHPGDFKLPSAYSADMKNLLGPDGQYSPIVADDEIALPYAEGRCFTSRPDDPLSCLTIQTLTDTPLKLYDGRMNHNNGWFVLRSEIPAGATRGAVRWSIRPTITPGWQYPAVIQTSQVGYHTAQPKVAIIELDKRSSSTQTATLMQLTPQGEKQVAQIEPQEWGTFLRYRYLKADFTNITEPGMYVLRYGTSSSSAFRIGSDVYDRGVWQPVVEYFLPVQMCHMRVNEKYRVWHDSCHMDDALMAPAFNHIDGYTQHADLLPFATGTQIPGVNVGGWHDAGDFDLRIESQAGECYILALAYEAFHPEIDATAIDQKRHITEIHQADGKNDILQQIEHGALSVVSGYKALGRLYRGIICGSLRQYAMLGDAAAMTDGIKGNADDRWIYTEDNPGRELSTAAQLAVTARVLRDFNPSLSDDCLDIARKVFAQTNASGRAAQNKLQAAAELYITTGEQQYLDYIVTDQASINGSEKSIFNDQLQFSATNLSTLARVEPLVRDSKDKRVRRWCKAYRTALEAYSRQLADVVTKTPYGVPYQPSIWGAGWDIQRFGFENYFLAAAYPDLFPKDPVFNALNFVLGCHPGLNQASFASGVGAKSATVAYGLNRADWSYIPGGVVSGTALIRPDFPELLTWPFLWQQTEYVLGGGSSHYMFLVLAVQNLLK